MLFRVVRPVAREGSRNKQFVKRIPVDLLAVVRGNRFTFRLGNEVHVLAVSQRAVFIKFSLRTDDPIEVKKRNAECDAYFDRVFRALRQDNPLRLTNEQATALAGRLYRAWANSERRERTIAVEQGPDGKMHVVEHEPLDDEHIFTASLMRLLRPGLHGKAIDLDHLPLSDDVPEPSDLEPTLGPLANRLLLAEGIGKVDPPSRGLLLVAFWLALRDALESRLRNAQGDYSPDPKAERFPAWVSPEALAPKSTAIKGGSLTTFIDGWWLEAKARGLKPSTHESYRNTMKAFVAFLKHDDAARVTVDDIRAFKDHRLATINPRTKRTLSAKTVKDSDLAALKAVFGWAVANGKMASNPAEGVSLKRPRKSKRRDKWFTDVEASSILKAALSVTRNGERSETFAAKRWVPWLLAYSGARVGEMAQLRKEDVHREGERWYITITPEAGTVKSDEARNVVLHDHLIELGFLEFVKTAPSGHLFLRPGDGGDVLGPLQGVKNRITEFVREVVTDKDVAPNHGWRHRFSFVCTEAGIEDRIKHAIMGHAVRSVADTYGGVSIKAQATALTKFPRYELS